MKEEGKIILDYEALKIFSETLMASYKVIETSKNEIQKIVNELINEEWVGNDANAFKEAISAYNNSLAQIMNELNGFSNCINNDIVPKFQLASEKYANMLGDI